MMTTTPDWCLGAVNPVKVVHRASCRYARQPYVYAREHPSASALAFDLVYKGADAWHRACKVCAADLAAEIDRYATSLRRQKAEA